MIFRRRLSCSFSMFNEKNPGRERAKWTPFSNNCVFAGVLNVIVSGSKQITLASRAGKWANEQQQRRRECMRHFYHFVHKTIFYNSFRFLTVNAHRRQIKRILVSLIPNIHHLTSKHPPSAVSNDFSWRSGLRGISALNIWKTGNSIKNFSIISLVSQSGRLLMV